MTRYYLLLSIFLISFINGCSKDSGTSNNTKNLPELSTGSATSITSSSVSCSGNITSEGGSEVSERGIFYSASSNPSSNGNKMVAGSGIGVFSVFLSGLQSNTIYYYQAFATNDDGTSYGEEKSFTTLSTQANPEINLTIANVHFDFDSISGLTTGSVYEAGFTEQVHIFALTAAKDTLRLSLIDNVDDANTLAIQPGKSLNIDVSGSSSVYSKLLFSKSDGTVYEATSGSISITQYELLNFNSHNTIFSGSFNVNASGTTITGTLTNILMDCSECGG